MTPRFGRLGAALALATLFCLSGAAIAWASFTATTAATATYSTATLAAASGLGAANVNCVALGTTQVRLTWTATSSSFADGYEIDRSLVAGGPYTQAGTVSGQATVTFTDTAVLFLTTYHYVVRATKAAWRSANSNEATITTPTTLCV